MNEITVGIGDGGVVKIPAVVYIRDTYESRGISDTRGRKNCVCSVNISPKEAREPPPITFTWKVYGILIKRRFNYLLLTRNHGIDGWCKGGILLNRIISQVISLTCSFSHGATRRKQSMAYAKEYYRVYQKSIHLENRLDPN